MATVTTYIIDDVYESTSTIIFTQPTEFEVDNWIPPLPSYESQLPTDLFAKPTSTAAAKILDKDIDKAPPERTLAIAVGVALPITCLIIFIFLYAWIVRDKVRKKRDADREAGYKRDAKMKKHYTSELEYSLDALNDFAEPPRAYGTKSHPRGILKNRITPDLSPDDIYTLLPPKPKLRSGFSPRFSYQRYFDEYAKWNRAKEAIEKALAAAKKNAEAVAKAREQEDEARRQAAEEMKSKSPEIQAEEIVEEPGEESPGEELGEEEKHQKEKVEKDREEAMKKLEQGSAGDADKPSPTMEYMNHLDHLEDLDECEKGQWVGDNGFEFERAQEDGDDYIKRHSWETDEASKKKGKQKKPASGSRFIEEV